MAAEGHNGGNSPSENPTRVRSFLRRVGPWSGQWHRLEGQGAQVDGWRPRVGRLSLSLEAAKVLGVVTDALRKWVARGTSTRTTALLAAICTALLTLIAVNPAFGVLVSRFQAEDMSFSSASISKVPDPDGTG